MAKPKQFAVNVTLIWKAENPQAALDITHELLKGLEVDVEQWGQVTHYEGYRNMEVREEHTA